MRWAPGAPNVVKKKEMNTSYVKLKGRYASGMKACSLKVCSLCC